MYTRLLLAYDGSVAGQDALLNCQGLPLLSGAKLTLIAIMVPQAYLPLAGAHLDVRIFTDLERLDSEMILEQGIQKLMKLGFLVDGAVFVGGAIHEITTAALRVQADLIVIAHAQRSWLASGLSGSALGSGVIDRAHCNVLVVKNATVEI